MTDWIKTLADKGISEGEQDDWYCPNCGWEVDESHYDDPGMFLGSRDYRLTTNPQQSMSAATWIEKWRCPECGTVWEYENCNF